MAIFMATTKSISRGSGQSAVASASYRAGEKLQDERYGKTQDYSKRHGVMSADIILPAELQGKTEIDRNTLWNMAERAEKRKDARVGREWIVNLPHELDEPIRKQLAHEFAQSLADKYGVIADCCIHRPTQKEIERGADPRNFHAHIMLTTRQAVVSPSGQILLGEKATIELSDTKRRSLGLERVSAEIVELRELWERTANTKLAEYGHELIDSRSYQSQGIDIIPQLKMGKNATQMERDGLQTPVGDINRLIKERNELVFSQELSTIEQTNQRADQIIFDSRKPKVTVQDNSLSNNQPEASITQPVTLSPIDLAIKTTRPNEADKSDETKKVGIVDEVVQTATSSSEDRAKQSFQSKYEQWKQQKNAPVAKVDSSSSIVTAANIDPPPVPTLMSFNERRQAWKLEQERKKQEAEEQRLAEQARLAEIAEKQRQAQIAHQQEQARQQALAQKQAELAEAKRLAQLEQERQAQVREAEQQKLAQQEQARQQELDRQHELERNRRRFSP